MTGRTRTLVGRLAAVQVGVTVGALAVVALAAAVTVTTLLSRRADRALLDVARRTGAVMERLPPETTIDPVWFAYEAEEQRSPGARIEVRGAEGTLLAGVGERFDLPPALTGCADRGALRVCGERTARFSVVVGASAEGDAAARRYVLIALLGLALAAAIVVASASRAVSQRALRPLTALGKRIADTEPGARQRVTERSGITELDAFAARFDELLVRFDAALDRERRLAAHASHELRTPLTLARAEIETLAGGASPPAPVTRALEALDRLSRLIEALLWFAKAQPRLDGPGMEIVNLADVVREEVAVRSDAPIRCALPDEALVRGDERLLARVTANLLDNAIKHGRGAPIEVRATQVEGRLGLTVVNAGALPAGGEERLFEPFFRGDGARVPGFGLGLPFARAVARSHGGDVTIEAARQGDTAFVLSLPLVGWSDEPAQRAPA